MSVENFKLVHSNVKMGTKDDLSFKKMLEFQKQGTEIKDYSRTDFGVKVY